MQLAKASKEDIEKMSQFFNQWELMEAQNWIFDPEDGWDEELIEEMENYLSHKFIDSWGDVNTDQIKLAFFKKWAKELDWRWRRVVIGCEVLIDNCCDPDKDVLALHPKFQPGATVA